MSSLLTSQSPPQSTSQGAVGLIIIGLLVGTYFYIRHWYKRPSETPETLKKLNSYETVEWMDFHAGSQKKDPEKYEIHKSGVIAYLKNRELPWRQRNDVIRYMKKANLVYEINRSGGIYYVLSPQGKDLRGTLRERARLLHETGAQAGEAKNEAAAIMAAALRVDARDASSEVRQRTEEQSRDIEEAVKAGDPEKIDRAITRTKDLLQIATYALPFAREILRILGLG